MTISRGHAVYLYKLNTTEASQLSQNGNIAELLSGQGPTDFILIKNFNSISACYARAIVGYISER
jgi:hypothetical protein